MEIVAVTKFELVEHVLLILRDKFEINTNQSKLWQEVRLVVVDLVTQATIIERDVNELILRDMQEDSKAFQIGYQTGIMLLNQRVQKEIEFTHMGSGIQGSSNRRLLREFWARILKDLPNAPPDAQGFSVSSGGSLEASPTHSDDEDNGT